MADEVKQIFSRAAKNSLVLVSHPGIATVCTIGTFFDYCRRSKGKSQDMSNHMIMRVELTDKE